ncbi:50S ribosomal protein L10 [bacterium]|nr:MAG: 50S ribosomal protein L10 [bacterium]
MPTAKKDATIEALRERMSQTRNVFLTDFRGLTVGEISKLRRALGKGGASYGVVKNTLFTKAAPEIAGQLEAYLHGPTAIVFAGEDVVAPAKALQSFIDETKRLEVKAAIVDGRVIGKAEVEQLSKLPSLDELRAQLVGVLVAPLQNLVSTLSGKQTELAGVLESLAEKKAASPAA